VARGHRHEATNYVISISSSLLFYLPFQPKQSPQYSILNRSQSMSCMLLFIFLKQQKGRHKDSELNGSENVRN